MLGRADLAPAGAVLNLSCNVDSPPHEVDVAHLNRGSPTGKRLQAFASGGFNVPTTQPAAPYFSMPVQAAGYDGPSSVAFSFPSSGNQQKDMDEAMFLLRTKIRGGR